MKDGWLPDGLAAAKEVRWLENWPCCHSTWKFSSYSHCSLGNAEFDIWSLLKQDLLISPDVKMLMHLESTLLMSNFLLLGLVIWFHHFNNQVIYSHPNVQFMVLLVLRYTLPIIIIVSGDYSLTLFTVRMH